MMRQSLLVTLTFTLFSCFEQEVTALTCLPCDQFECNVIDESTCEYGTRSTNCGCCTACQNGPGDLCGGPFEVFGGCAVGLWCQKEDWFGDGVCVTDTENLIRKKRGLASHRFRVGLSRRQPTSHRHNAYGGIPPHILKLLKSRRNKLASERIARS